MVKLYFYIHFKFAILYIIVCRLRQLFVKLYFCLLNSIPVVLIYALSHPRCLLLIFVRHILGLTVLTSQSGSVNWASDTTATDEDWHWYPPSDQYHQYPHSTRPPVGTRYFPSLSRPAWTHRSGACRWSLSLPCFHFARFHNFSVSDVTFPFWHCLGSIHKINSYSFSCSVHSSKYNYIFVFCIISHESYGAGFQNHSSCKTRSDVP